MKSAKKNERPIKKRTKILSVKFLKAKGIAAEMREKVVGKLGGKVRWSFFK